MRANRLKGRLVGRISEKKERGKEDKNNIKS